MKDDYGSDLSKMIESGIELNEALGQLREMGASSIKTIKAIRDAQGVSLGEAKIIFSDCPAWALEVEAAQELHDEIIEALENEKNTERLD